MGTDQTGRAVGLADMQLIAWITAAPPDSGVRPLVSRRHLRQPGAARTLCGAEIPSHERATFRISLAAEACKRCERAWARRAGPDADRKT
jgi:hypothetical protein